MKPRKRKDLIELFSSFLFFQENRVQWVGNSTLSRQMKKYLEEYSSFTSSEYWALLFHQKWLELGKENNSYRQHLYAYLQESCYWASKSIYDTYKTRYNYTTKDYFNIGILKFDKLLSNFNPKLNKKLSNYTSQRLKWRILERMRDFDKTFGHTIWSLLLNSPEKRGANSNLNTIEYLDIRELLRGKFIYVKVFNNCRSRCHQRSKP